MKNLQAKNCYGNKEPISQPISDSTPAPSNPPNFIWANFSFDPTALVALKSLATETISSSYISTDDALSAFIWQSVIRARLPRLNPTSKSTFARTVDPRRYLDIPPTYTGFLQNGTFNTDTVQRVINEPLGFFASQFRSAVDPKTSTLGYSTRARATALNRSTDKGITVVPTTMDLSSSDMSISSWANKKLYDLDFNVGLGKPESVRMPKSFPAESFLFILPKRPDGELVVVISLRDEDMERLRMDEEFAKYGKYIG